MTIRWMRLNPGGREAGSEKGGLLIVFLGQRQLQGVSEHGKEKSFGARRKGKREVGEVVSRAFSPRIAHRWSRTTGGLEIEDFLGCRLMHCSLRGNRAALPVTTLKLHGTSPGLAVCRIGKNTDWSGG